MAYRRQQTGYFALSINVQLLLKEVSWYLKKLCPFVLFTVIALALILSIGFCSAAFALEIVNANRTGEKLPEVGLLRNLPGQQVHGNFKLNTNSCASCHMRHTARGERLLFHAGTSNVCLVCHDGTMGFLNVMAQPVAGGFGGSVAAGTFGVTTVATSVYGSSVHNIDLFPSLARKTQLFDAPGGRGDGTGERGAWTPEFTCISCHAPHGSYSIRLLHFNVNQIAVRPRVNSVVYGVYGGLYQVSANTNFTVGEGAFDPGSQLWRIPLRNNVPSAPWVFGYTYAHLVLGERLPQYWTRIYAPALFNPNTIDGGLYADPTVDVGESNAPQLLTRFFTINYATGDVSQTDTQRSAFLGYALERGFSEAAALALDMRIDVAQALQVRARASSVHQASLDAGLRALDLIDPTSYEAPAFNLFCSACHTDYLPTITAVGQRQRGIGVGIYSNRYRHSVNIPVNISVYSSVALQVYGWTDFSGSSLTGSPAGSSNQLMCLSCHFSHGTDARLMLFADGTPVTAGTGEIGTATDPGQVDRNSSSALKRFINSAGCLTCHFGLRP